MDKGLKMKELQKMLDFMCEQGLLIKRQLPGEEAEYALSAKGKLYHLEDCKTLEDVHRVIKCMDAN